ncbi:MAG: HTTM domain-containing protein [Polyangiaceae bacterium]
MKERFVREVKAWLDAIGRTEVLGAMRIAIGCLLFAQAFEAYGELQQIGYFADHFHMALIPERYVASRAFYTYLLFTRMLLALPIAIGVQARPALFVSSLLGFYVLACDKLEFHHNRYALLLYTLLLALTPCDRSWRLVGKRTLADQTGPMWAVHLARLQVSIIYLGSGGSKLFDPDWRDGTMVLQRFIRYGGEALAAGVPQSVITFLSQPLLTSLIAKGAIASELFIAFGLQFRRTRRAALWWGIVFHLMIETTSKVELFTWVTLVAYAFFVTMDSRARVIELDGSRSLGRVLGRALRLLDWFVRFDVRPWPEDRGPSKHLFVVTRRDGKRVSGLRAYTTIAESTPLFFLLWAPLAVLSRFAKAPAADT